MIFHIIFLLTAMAIIGFDSKTQEIPWVLVILNYNSFAMLVNPFLLFGNILIVWCILQQQPIDCVYIIAMCFIALLSKNSWNVLCVFPILFQALLSKREKISLMISIEIGLVILLYLVPYIV